MKKFKNILLIVLVIILCMKFIPFGSYNYKNESMSSSLKIPKLSFFDKECCMYASTFKSFRSKYILKKELDKIMNNYEKVNCNSNVYYYDKENNVTISEYGIDGGILINRYYIVYDKGSLLGECKEE